MKGKQQVHNLIILDESGSMISIKESIIGGFNELIQTIKAIEKENSQQEHYISLLSFNGLGSRYHLFADSVDNVKEIDEKLYHPNSMTPLFDAIGNSVNRLKEHIKETPDTHVLVTIFTDGEENSSKEYKRATIKALIEEMKSKNWTFTYIGTDHDIDKFADSISINNHLYFERSPEEIRKAFELEAKSRFRFNRNLALGCLLSDTNYFIDED